MEHEGVKQFFKLFGPALIGVAVTQINLIVNRRFASGLEEGILSNMDTNKEKACF